MQAKNFGLMYMIKKQMRKRSAYYKADIEVEFIDALKGGA
jgi:hypothetical protein